MMILLQNVTKKVIVDEQLLIRAYLFLQSFVLIPQCLLLLQGNSEKIELSMNLIRMGLTTRLKLRMLKRSDQIFRI